MNYLWVVEMLSATQPDRWLPTHGVGLTKESARMEMGSMRWDNPDDKFRIRKYAAINNTATDGERR